MNYKWLLFFVLSININAQDINCKTIEEGIRDDSLYTKIGNRFIFTPNLNNQKLYRVKTKSNGIYYVREEIMKEIRACIKKINAKEYI